MHPVYRLLLLLWFGCPLVAAPLHDTIDTAIRTHTKDAPVSARSDDAEFLRRVYLDFAGHIPTPEQTKAFLADDSPEKRTKLIDALLNGPDYAKRMSELFHIMFMERLGDHADWSMYLKTVFEQNRPWDQMARDILRADATNTHAKGASFFMAKRLENYGQNPVDYPALTRDLGRLFLGKNLQCAQCHDHLFIDEYKQQDYQGLFAFIQNTYLVDAKTAHVAEKPTVGKVAFMSVFKKQPKETGPALPGGKEVEPPPFKKGEEYVVKPDPKSKTPGTLKFSPLALLAEQLPTKDNADFAKNIVNRLWFMFMGRGLVHPLDLHHQGNPASHPELLDLLAKAFVEHRFDIKWFVRELALTDTYQRSSILPTGAKQPAPEMFATALEKRLSAEQLLASLTIALNVKVDATAQAKFLKAFANAPREPEEEVAPSLRAALFVLNDPLVLGWFTPQPGSLLERVQSLPDGQIAEELYLALLSRKPTNTERERVTVFFQKPGVTKVTMASRWAWALAASTEFNVNH